MSFCLRSSSDIIIALIFWWVFLLFFFCCCFVCWFFWVFLGSPRSLPPLYSHPTESQLCSICDHKRWNYQCTDMHEMRIHHPYKQTATGFNVSLFQKGALCVCTKISKCILIFLLAQMVKDGLLPHSKQHSCI